MDASTYIPQAPVVVVCGHYGVGKTNFSLNVALDAAARGVDVTLVDLDVVNPFFRSSDYEALLDTRGVRVIAPVFAGTNLDGPSLSGTILPAIEQARAVPKGAPPRLLVIDAGGDDVGATALGRFAPTIEAGSYEMLYVVNRSRNLTQQPPEAAEVLREIEVQSHLHATAIVNNTHLQDDTDVAVIEQGAAFARAVSKLVNLPLTCTTVPADLVEQVVDRESSHLVPNEEDCVLYPVQVYVRTPWQ